MKYLIVSDIHGSLPALEKVLAFYREQQCDLLCILGDILNYGPRNGLPEGLDPKGIAERLNAMAGEIVAIRGNCDSEVDQMLLDFPILSERQTSLPDPRTHLQRRKTSQGCHRLLFLRTYASLETGTSGRRRGLQYGFGDLPQGRKRTDLCHLRKRNRHGVPS